MKIWKRDYYDKLFRERGKTVEDYQLQIAHAQDKIRELQSQCAHANTKVGFWSWRPGAMQPARLCEDCRAIVGEATPEESKKLWDAYHGSVQTTAGNILGTEDDKT